MKKLRNKENRNNLNKSNATRKYEKNVKADYLFCFLRNFDIASAVWVLYMVYRGLPLWQIGIVEGIFHLSSFLFEVPSGALADLLGRKKVMIVGRIFYVVAAVIELFSTNIYQFAFAFVISALSYNLNSGSEEAFVYDSMKCMGEENKYIKVSGRLNVIIEVASALATFVGGVCAEYSYTLCYCCVAMVALLSIVPALFFEEPPMEKKDEKVSLKDHFITSYQIIRTNPEILKILLYYPVVMTFYTVVYFYGQQFFAEYGFNKIHISVIVLFASGFACLGALSSDKLLKIFGDNMKYIASVVMGLSILVMSVNSTPVSIAGFGVASFVNSLLYPVESKTLNELIPSEQRATIISVDSMFFSIAMIVFFPLSGLIATKFDLHIAFFILGAVQLIMMCVLLTGKKNRVKES